MTGATDFADVTNDDVIRLAVAAASPKAKFPPGFKIKDGSLWYDNGDGEPLFICRELKVLAQTRDDVGSSWGLLVQWADDDARSHRWAMPRSMLAGESADIRHVFLDRGLPISPSAKARLKLADFLGTVSISTRARAVDRVGWTEGAFALPDRTIGEEPGRIVIYQGPAANDHQYRVAGDLAEWQARIGRFGVGNTRLALALSAAFVGPLLEIIGEEGGGVNYRGSSSIGKSTALAAAASAWGPPPFVRQWRATANGLEGVAVQHSETLLCLDELGQLDPREAGTVAYMLANGMGKSRAGRTGALRSPARWRVMFLSSGEISLGDVANRDFRGTRRAAAGQEVRILDVEADAGSGFGLFENLHGLASAELLARTLKDGAIAAHGVAGPAFVEFLAKNLDTVPSALRKAIDEFTARHVPAGANGQVARAARRFGIIAAAGELAARVGILPWSRGEADGAAAAVFASWLASRGGVGAAEDREAVAKVRAFLEAHGSSRFEQMERATAEEVRIYNRAGFWRTGDGGREFLVLPEAWRNEVCSGMDANRVARILSERGMLRTAAGRHNIPTRLPGMGLVRCFIITPEVFGEGDA